MIGPKALRLNFQFSDVNELLDEHWANIDSEVVQSESISTPIYVQSDSIYQS